MRSSVKVVGQRCVNTLPHDQPRYRLMDQSLEEWRPVVGYEGLYEVSSLGRVRGLRRLCKRRDGLAHIQPEVMLKQSVSGPRRNYLKVGLLKNGEQKTCRVSVLVAAAFLGPRPDGTVVAHGPAGSLDNSLRNISYKSPSENQGEDRLRDGTDARGEKHSQSRLNRHQVLFARRIRETKHVSLRFLAKEWGVSLGTLHNAVTGRSWNWL